MTEVEFDIHQTIDLDLPAEVTVNGVTVKGKYYTYTDDTGASEYEYKYWQYEDPEGDWIIWVDLITDGNAAHVRATADDENEWFLDDGVRFEELAGTIEAAAKDIDRFYKEMEEEE